MVLITINIYHKAYYGRGEGGGRRNGGGGGGGGVEEDYIPVATLSPPE